MLGVKFDENDTNLEANLLIYSCFLSANLSLINDDVYHVY